MKISKLLVLVYILFSLNNYAQNCKSSEHKHKQLDESKALSLFGFENFINQFTEYTKTQGYNIKQDECLRNFFYTYQSNLVRRIFDLYIEENTITLDYNVLFDKHLKDFKEQLEVFKLHEQQLRNGFEKIANSQSTANINKGIPSQFSPQAACTNMNFETGNLSGWTTDSQSGTWGGTNSAYVTTPGTDAAVLAIDKVFAGGFSACIDVLGSGSDLDWREISQTFQVTNANKDFVFYVAVIIDGGAHTCSSNSKFEVSVTDASNNIVPCSDISLIGSGAGGAQCSEFTGWNTSGWYDYLNWTPVIVPLGSLVGQNVTIKFRVTRCNGGGGHGARAYLEADCNPAALSASGNIICPGKVVNLNAPNTPGYIYNWSGPSGFSANTYSVAPSLAGVYSVTMALASNPTCKMVLDTILTSVPSPTANFNYTVTPCLTTFSVPFSDVSSPAAGDPISSLTWVWGDATANDSGTNPTHTYASVGTKTVELKIQSTGGCRDSIRYSFNILATPTATFNTANVCFGTSATFTSSSLPPTPAILTNQSWSFGDGGTDAGANASHTYSISGTYPVKLVVTNDQLCKDSIVKNVTIYPMPIVSFSATPVCLNLTTVFTNSSSVAAPDNITIWSWDFDNNGTSDNGAQFPTNTFTAIGNHIVELKATTNNGCKDSTTFSVVINAIQTAVFTASNACLNSPVSIVNTTTVTPPDVITSYNWDFGVDASPATANSYNAPLLSYSTSGIKTITLNLTASSNCTANLVQSVVVYPQPIANFSTTSVCQSTATAFTDMSTPTGSITNWQWDFTNDGFVDNTTNAPTNVYASSGTYTTSLIVTDNYSCSDTTIASVIVFGHAVPDFTATSVCSEASTTFSNLTSISTNSNTGTISQYDWDFGDLSPVISTTNPSHTYTAGTTGAIYNVTLTTTTSNNCIDNVVKTVTVYPLPVLSYTLTNACLNSNVGISNTSTINTPDNITDYDWNFGLNALPSTTSTVQNPNALTYSTSGVKTVTLTLTSNHTCTATATQMVTIYPQPVANFSTTSVCQSTATVFSDLSLPTGSITAWQWDFSNNGSIDNTTNAPSFVYLASGSYTASLIVTDNNSCKDTIALPLEVWGHTIPDFTPDAVCFGTATTFSNLTNTSTNENVGGTPGYIWDFADGSPANGLTDPSHTYTLGGNVNATYNVTLTSISTHNCIDNIVKPVSVYAIPTASFTSDSVCLGTITQLTDVSNGNGNTFTNYEWDFLNNSSIDATGISNPNFMFPVYGINAVSYTVTTSPITGLTCKNTTNTITVWVNPNPVADFTFINKCINAQPNSFDASSSSIAVGSNTLYAWEYGDASNGSGITSTHIYTTAQVYNTTLTVTSNKGCQNFISKQVEVFQKPFVTVANSNACDGKSMTFTATAAPASPAIANFEWDLNNTINTMEVSGQTINNIFAAAGNHTVNLVSTSVIGGCKDTLIVPVFVDYLPVPEFTVDKPMGCPLPHCVRFSDLSASVPSPAQIVNWKWVLGDGTEINSSTNANQSNCYTNASSSQLAQFDVKLVLTTNKGCVDSLTKDKFITVYPKPIAQYSVEPNPTNILAPTVYFTNQSQDYINWWWNYGDSDLLDSVNKHPVHDYDGINAGDYYSYLIVSNQYNCTDKTAIKVDVKPDFVFYIPNAFTPANGDGINDVFTGMGVGISKYEMWIYDRWGERVFYSNDIELGWNGKFQGKDDICKQDIYAWKVRLKDVFGKNHEYVGHVTLIQ